MSEIDAPRTAPAAANRPWTSSARGPAAPGTLRGRSPTGLVDAFAEVFARMAAPTSPRRGDPRRAGPDTEAKGGAAESIESRGPRPDDPPADSAAAPVDPRPPAANESQPPSSGDADQQAESRHQRPADRLTAHAETTQQSEGRNSPRTQPPGTQSAETRPEGGSATTGSPAAEAMQSDVNVAPHEVGGETKHEQSRGPSSDPAASKTAAPKGAHDAADALAKGRDTEAKPDSDVPRPGDPNDAKHGPSVTEPEPDPRSRRAASEPDANQRGDAGANGKRPAAGAVGDASSLPRPTPGAATDGGREASAIQPPTAHTAASPPAAAAVSDSRAASGLVSASNGSAATAGKPSGRGTVTQPTFSIHDSSRPAGEAAAHGRGDSAAAPGGKEIVSRIKLIQRVSRAFQHLGRNGGTVRMRLAPAELGTVRIEMRVQDNQVSARVVAETDAASQALREHLPDLRLRLESQGMRVERIEVQTESGEPRDARDQDEANRDPGRQSMGDDTGHRQPRRPLRGAEGDGPGSGDNVSQAVSGSAATAAENASVSGGVDARF